MNVRDKMNQMQSDQAWKIGVEYGSNNAPDLTAETSESMYRDCIALGCSPAYFDVFKYGAQSIWRSKGALQ